MKAKIAQNNPEVLEIKTKLWTTNYTSVWVSAFILFLAFTSMTPTLPVYMEIYSNITGAAGFPLAALTIGAVLSRPFAGWGIDQYGRKSIFWGGIMLFLLPSVAFVWMLEATPFIVLRFFQGVGWGFCNTALTTVASDNIPISRMGEGMGLFTLTASFALLAGPAMGLWVVDNYSFSLYFISISVITFISVIPMLLIKFQNIYNNSANNNSAKPRLVFLDKDGIKPALVTLLHCVCNSAAFSFLPVYAILQGLPTSWVFFTAFPISSIIFRPYFGRLADKKGTSGCDIAVIIGVAAQILAMLVLARTSTTVHLAIGGLFFGIGAGATQLAMFAATIRSLPSERRGAANATYWTAFDLGIAIGSVLWGMVAVALGYYLMFHLTIVFSFASLLVYFIVKPHTANQSHSGDPVEG